MAGASRQVVAGDSLLVCPKTGRRRLAVCGAGVTDWDEMMSSEVRRPASLHLLLALTSSMSLRWSLCPQPTLGHQGNLSSCQLDDPQLPTEILTYGHPKLDGWHPGRPRLDGAGAGGEGRGSEQGARQLRRRPVLLAPECFQKQGAGVSLCGALEWLIEREAEVRCAGRDRGGKAGGWAADGVRRPGGSPPGAGGVVGPLLHAQVRSLRPAQVNDVRRPLLPPLPTSAQHSRALVCTVGPAVWPSTFRRHGRLWRSARGFRESAELWSVSRPRR